MRTPLAVAIGLAAGALCVHTASAVAAEGSSLRGLRLPLSALQGERPVQASAAEEQSLKRGALDAAPDFASRFAFDTGRMVDSQRFAGASFDLRSSVYQPVGQNISNLADANANPFYEALPRYTLSNQLSRGSSSGWGMGLGVRQREYSYVTTNLVSVSAEHAWGNLRSGYTMYSNRADGSALGSAQRFQVSYAYGDRNSVGLAYTTGRDVENPALTLGLQPADVRDWSLSGRHWLSPNWALTYDVLSQEHAYLARRQGLRLGVSRSF